MAQLWSVKDHKLTISQIKEKLPQIKFNGLSAVLNQSLYTILSISLPPTKYDQLLLFNLDLLGVRILTFSFCILSSCLEMHDIGQLRSFV